MKPVTEMPDGVYHKGFRTFGTLSHTPRGIMGLNNPRLMCVESQAICLSDKVPEYFCTLESS